jgi:hypothetical protein
MTNIQNGSPYHIIHSHRMTYPQKMQEDRLPVYPASMHGLVLGGVGERSSSGD